MKILRPLNIFTLLAVALTFAFVFRLVNVATFRQQPEDGIGIMTPASAETVTPQTEKGGDPTAEDLSNAVKETARKAEEPDGAAPAAGDMKAQAAKAKEEAMPPPPDNTYTSFSASEVEVLQSLAKRRDELDRREKRLAEREALLSAAEEEVDHKITELNKLKGELEALLGQQQTAEAARIDSLVQIYAEMKPKEAAAIFNTLDMEVLLPVISKMSEKSARKVSPILAAMDPEKARIVTIRLAQQRELPSAVIKKAVQGQMGGESPP